MSLDNVDESESEYESKLESEYQEKQEDQLPDRIDIDEQESCGEQSQQKSQDKIISEEPS